MFSERSNAFCMSSKYSEAYTEVFRLVVRKKLKPVYACVRFPLSFAFAVDSKVEIP